MYCLACFSGIFQEAVGRDRGPCTPSPVPSFLFFFIRAIVLSISDILNFKVTASNSAAALDYIYFLRVALNYWVSNELSCFTFDALVCPVVF